MRRTKRFARLSVVSLTIMILLLMGHGSAEGIHVTADLLNGRTKPNRHSQKVALFDYGDDLQITGKWSADHNWIEVGGGEAGLVWVHIDYVSETVGTYTVRNDDYAKIKIRRSPVNGRVSGYLKRGQEVEIDRDVLGWGHCYLGWVDLSLVAEVYGDDY